MSRPRLSHQRHPMFEPHQPNEGWLTMAVSVLLGVVVAFGLVYGMAAQ